MSYRCKNMIFFKEIKNIFEKVAATFKKDVSLQCKTKGLPEP